MNKEETLECIKVMQHYADGGDIELYDNCSEEWVDANGQEPSWIWTYNKYRIKKAAKKIKLEAFLVDGLLSWFKEGSEDGWPRVPSEDKWVEVEVGK